MHSDSTRSNDPKTYISTAQPTMGPLQNRRICRKDQPSGSDLLVIPARPISSRNRRFSTNLAEDGIISVSSVEIDSTSSPPNQALQRFNADYTDVDYPTLVAVAPSIPPTSNPLQISTQPMDNDRVEIIHQFNIQQGLDRETSEFLLHATRDNTNKLYNGYWKRFANCCVEHSPPIDPTVYNAQVVLEFLMGHQHFSVSNLNTYRSAIASVYKTTHPTQGPLADDPIVVNFFRAKRNKTIQLPKEHQLPTWDTDIMKTYILERWPENTSISTAELQQNRYFYFVWRQWLALGRILVVYNFKMSHFKWMALL
jgi:hypothetical protein